VRGYRLVTPLSGQLLATEAHVAPDVNTPDIEELRNKLAQYRLRRRTSFSERLRTALMRKPNCCCT
jgi:hypothetical protein